MADKKKIAVESRDVLPLSPTLLWKTQLKSEDYERMNSDITTSLDKLFAGKPRLMPGERLQTEQKLHQLEEFHPPYLIHDRRRVELLHVVYDSFEITGCWANVAAVNADHRTHSHPNNYLSGVYYVQTKKVANTIRFEDPRPQSYVMLPHQVEPSESDKERLSVSFNVMFPSYTETMSAPKRKGSIEVDQNKACVANVYCLRCPLLPNDDQNHRCPSKPYNARSG